MLLRQYKRVRAIKNDQFSYNDMKPVYTIVFMEKSPEIFHKSPTQYIHKFWNKSDTGLELNLLQNYVFIPIDIFLARLHNKGIKSKLDAWLTFLGSDDVGYIDKLITKYPEFRPMYQQLYDMCCNVEGVMQMFSKELEIMDHNTVRLMIDEYQERLEKMRKNEDELSIKIQNQVATIEDQNATIEDQNATIEDQNATIEDQNATIEDQNATIENQKATIDEQQKRIAELEAALARK
jgi:methyl-accepting chemotaxis protein